MQERSNSPSKSIRSLARHLERGDENEVKGKTVQKGNGSPTKTPTKERRRGTVCEGAAEDREGGGGGWKSLWSLDYEIESPRK